MANERISAPCRCGKVEFEIVGPPILHGICYCTSCQEAGRRHQANAGADPVVAADGGTDYVLYRKDRVRCVRGGELLEERRLKPEGFARIHRSRLVNVSRIKELRALSRGVSIVVLKNGVQLEASFSFLKAMQEQLDIAS